MAEYNKVDPSLSKQQIATSGLSTIQILLEGSGKLSGNSFNPTYALVVTWGNAYPYPASYYPSEVSWLLISNLKTWLRDDPWFFTQEHRFVCQIKG